MMKKLFTHEFVDGSQESGLSIDTDAAPPARIKMKVDKEGGFWLTANSDGWLHLAKVCAELGMGSYEDGYHFHKDENFEWSTGAPEFTFMLENDKP